MDTESQTQAVNLPVPPPPICSYGTPAQLAALYAALAAAQGEFEPIVKNRDVAIAYKDDQGRPAGTYSFRYADLEEITAKTRPALAKNKLATIQPLGPAANGSGVSLFTQLVHADGGMLISELTVSTGFKDIKGMGAQISYLRRYAKSAMLDLAADDDLDEQPPQSPGGDSAEPDAIAVSTEPTDDGFYTDERFTKTLPNWIAAMAKGKTPAQIIRTATTKLRLTDDQIKIIHDNAPQVDAQ
ncbi:ERF family protein [Agrobacterium tumefaciens]|uniref:ERF family protein n=1 Tax=Agrobacterium tumefaciens TaxID=358 RepID=UPI00157416BE|nr:hypothetical protein [Agrobacterium tumefaciens]